MLSSPAVAGPGIFGTKASAVPTVSNEAPIGAFPVIQMLLALGVVLALIKWVLPGFFKKYGSRIGTKSSSGIHIQETATIGPATVAVVTVRGRTFLVGASPQSVDCLADLTEAQTAHEALPTFAELVETQAKPQPNPMGDLAGQLERLKTLGL